MSSRSRFLSSISPLTSASRFFLIFPFRLDPNHCKISKYNFFISIVIINAMSVHHFFEIVKTSRYFSKFGFPWQNLYTGSSFIVQIAHLSSYMSYMLRFKSIAKIIDDMLALNDFINKRSFSQNFYKFLLTQNLIFFMLRVAAYSSNSMYFPNSWKFFLGFLTRIYTGNCSLFVLLQFIDLTLFA